MLPVKPGNLARFPYFLAIAKRREPSGAGQ